MFHKAFLNYPKMDYDSIVMSTFLLSHSILRYGNLNRDMSIPPIHPQHQADQKQTWAHQYYANNSVKISPTSMSICQPQSGIGFGIE